MTRTKRHSQHWRRVPCGPKLESSSSRNCERPTRPLRLRRALVVPSLARRASLRRSTSLPNRSLWKGRTSTTWLILSGSLLRQAKRYVLLLSWLRESPTDARLPSDSSSRLARPQHHLPHLLLELHPPSLRLVPHGAQASREPLVCRQPRRQQLSATPSKPRQRNSTQAFEQPAAA